jgi:cobalt-zinc-cadmium efflux system protein
VQATLASVPGVCDVHDLHVWTLASGMEVASAHLALDPRAEMGEVLATARQTLHARFHIDHATLQIEPAGSHGACRPVGW